MNGTYRWTPPPHANGGRPAISGSRTRGVLPALTGAGLRRALRWLFNLTLGCTHRKKSFPFTPVRRNADPGAAGAGTYVVCLDCGTTFDYDWNQMQMATPTAAPPIRGSATLQPRIPAIKLEPARPRPAAPPPRYESPRSRVRSLTA
jgi:hypothetical protein